MFRPPSFIDIFGDAPTDQEYLGNRYAGIEASATRFDMPVQGQSARCYRRGRNLEFDRLDRLGAFHPRMNFDAVVRDKSELAPDSLDGNDNAQDIVGIRIQTVVTQG